MITASYAKRLSIMYASLDTHFRSGRLSSEPIILRGLKKVSKRIRVAAMSGRCRELTICQTNFDESKSCILDQQKINWDIMGDCLRSLGYKVKLRELSCGDRLQGFELKIRW